MIIGTGVGRLVKDIEVIYSKSNMAIAKGTIVVNEYDGRKKEEVAKYYDFVCFDKTAERIGKLGNKGTMLVISGKFSYDDYVNKDDEKRRSYQIMVSDFDLVKTGGGNKGGKDNSQSTYNSKPKAEDPIEEDSIPF